jgi:formylglycine-generating enzyme required for sulfatase activity
VAQLGDTWINPKDGAVMVYIPAGEFLMGDDDDAIKDYYCCTNARNNPRHTVKLSGYWIYKDLVTVGMYKRYCQDTGKQMPPEPEYALVGKFNPGWSKEDHPIVDVSWNDAVAYCVWASVALPTEAQWEKAARGADGLKYPWGNEFDVSKVWASKAANGDAGGTTSVGRYAVSPYGCTDMAGNVWQWCADWYDAGFWGGRQAEGADPVNLTVGEQKFRAQRGGSWYFIAANYFRASYRSRFLPDYRDSFDGFRCASGQ